MKMKDLVEKTLNFVAERKELKTDIDQFSKVKETELEESKRYKRLTNVSFKQMKLDEGMVNEPHPVAQALAPHFPALDADAIHKAISGHDEVSPKSHATINSTPVPTLINNLYDKHDDHFPGGEAYSSRGKPPLDERDFAHDLAQVAVGAHAQYSEAPTNAQRNSLAGPMTGDLSGPRLTIHDPKTGDILTGGRSDSKRLEANRSGTDPRAVTRNWAYDPSARGSRARGVPG